MTAIEVQSLDYFYVGDNFGCDNDGDGRGDFADGVTCTELAGAEPTHDPNSQLLIHLTII